MTCQRDGCEADAEWKARFVKAEGGREFVGARYLCIPHLHEEIGPWLGISRKVREAFGLA